MLQTLWLVYSKHLISTIRGSIKINYLCLQSQRISDSTAEKCCDQCAKEQCVSSSSCSVLQIGPSSRQHDMISQCSLSAYTQLVVHAQLWCQSLCGKSWCMEWGACWAVWVFCCHDNHPLEVCCAKRKKKKGKLVYVRLQFCSSSSKSRLFRFAWQSSCYSRAELLWSPKRCCNQQSLLSPIRSQS